MNTGVLAADARSYARKLEDTGRAKGLTREQAREDAARRLGMTPGTFDSLSRDRIKDPFRLMGIRARLHAAVDRMLQQEEARIAHELRIHREKAHALDPHLVAEAQAALSQSWDETTED